MTHHCDEEKETNESELEDLRLKQINIFSTTTI